MEPEQEYRRVTRGIGLLFAGALLLLFLLLIARQVSGYPAGPSPSNLPELTERPLP